MEPRGSPVYMLLVEAGFSLHTCIDLGLCVMASGGRSYRGCYRVGIPVDWPMKPAPVRGGFVRLPRGIEGGVVRVRDPASLEVIAEVEAEGRYVKVPRLEGGKPSWVLLDPSGGPPRELLEHAERILRMKPLLVYTVRLYTMGGSWHRIVAYRMQLPLAAPGGKGVFGGPEDACRASLRS